MSSSYQPFAVLDFPNELRPLRDHIREINETLTDRSICYYCGQTSESEDHVIPHSLLHHKGKRRVGWEIDTLPSCHECNSCLGSHVFDTLKERMEHLLSVYNKRFAKLLKATPWTAEELQDLSYSVRCMAEHFNAQIGIAKARIGYLEGHGRFAYREPDKESKPVEQPKYVPTFQIVTEMNKDLKQRVRKWRNSRKCVSNRRPHAIATERIENWRYVDGHWFYD